MDEEKRYSSWVRRTSFSHTVCHRLDFSRLQSFPVNFVEDKGKELKPASLKATNSLPVNRYSEAEEEKGMFRTSSSFSLKQGLQSNRLSSRPRLGFHSSSYSSLSSALGADGGGGGLKATRSSSNLASIDSRIEEEPKSKGKKSGMQEEPKSKGKKSGIQGEPKSKGKKSGATVFVKQRSLSPVPKTVIPESFKEARANKKRFSTPPPSRRGSSGLVFSKLFSREATDHRKAGYQSPPEMSHLQLMSLKTSSRVKGKKDTTWARYFDHGGGKVAAVETTKEWMLDFKELYLGLRFASGAHSRLFHGIYKDEPVAVKIIRQPDDDENGELAARLEKQFYREVTHISHLYHNNVIKLVGAYTSPPVFCIVTEYLSGGSLRAFLHKLQHKLLPLVKVVEIALGIARGMEYIHSQGVIHRDLKPENIIFDESFCVKIADFGIACEEAYCDVLAEDPGTYRWMAPEMIKHKSYGRKVDVYSFGLVLWEMVSGRIPYEEMTPIQAAFAVVDKNSRPIISTACPPAMRALIEQCWALSSEKRPEFWQIVKVLEQFESALSQHGSLDLVKLTCHEHKHRLSHWIHMLKPSHSSGVGHTMPKLL